MAMAMLTVAVSTDSENSGKNMFWNKVNLYFSYYSHRQSYMTIIYQSNSLHK